MLVAFESLPKNARIWIYQADRFLSASEEENIKNFLENNLQEWASHGNPLSGSYKLMHHKFVIIAVNPEVNEASGCSIDTSSRWFKEIYAQSGIDFFDRSQAFLENSEIKTFSLFQAKKQVNSGNINPETLIFNNQITQLSELENHWLIKAENSYLSKFFEQVS